MLGAMLVSPEQWVSPPRKVIREELFCILCIMGV